MKFGVREICDVVLKAKATQTVGNKKFYRGEPVIYFDTLKTSSMEGAATTVYAQGGRGNSRLMAWEGERTVTFTMEDALISPEGFMILSGAGLIEGTNGENSQKIYQHVTEQISVEEENELGNKRVKDIASEDLKIELKESPYLPKDKNVTKENYIYVMLLKDGEIISEPYIATSVSGKNIVVHKYDTVSESSVMAGNGKYALDPISFASIDGGFDAVLIDYYVERTAGAKQIEITPDKFGGNYYLEASTLFRDTNGTDYPAEFIIPNCKIQSNFTFTMASSGDPSTFTFTMDAFPDYTKFDKSKKVLAAIQIINETEVKEDEYRKSTKHEEKVSSSANEVTQFTVDLNTNGRAVYSTMPVELKIGDKTIVKTKGAVGAEKELKSSNDLANAFAENPVDPSVNATKVKVVPGTSKLSIVTKDKFQKNSVFTTENLKIQDNGSYEWPMILDYEEVPPQEDSSLSV